MRREIVSTCTPSAISQANAVWRSGCGVHGSPTDFATTVARPDCAKPSLGAGHRLEPEIPILPLREIHRSVPRSRLKPESFGRIDHLKERI